VKESANKITSLLRISKNSVKETFSGGRKSGNFYDYEIAIESKRTTDIANHDHEQVDPEIAIDSPRVLDLKCMI
jgi:hypothetical protein